MMELKEFADSGNRSIDEDAAQSQSIKYKFFTQTFSKEIKISLINL